MTDCDEISVRGDAYSGGGRDIIRVDISVGGGTIWSQAKSIGN